jgi:4-hydroxythreonine-4-phosphate dehydrogenase
MRREFHGLAALIRTSPVHGTGFTMQERTRLPDSFRQAMLLALDIHRNRLMYQELTEDPVPAVPNKT